jgi:beta-fructofuranosidase
MRDFFYRPEGAWAGDFIPFYKNGRFHLFYLLAWRDTAGHGEGMSWYQTSTNDFVHFTDHGEMLHRGTVEEQDLFVYTGSVVEGEGRYHIFYTGHNPHLRKQGEPEQGVMHAVSGDLMKWEKVPGELIFAPPGRFEPHDWRDAFVFWNADAHEYWMLLAARLTNGPARRRGCTALCVSKDLKKWDVREPFWTPGLYYTHECPDLFRMGDWWYLVFSEFTERVVTHYRMSKSLNGPWLAPDNDTFDGRAFYAAKTASDGLHRFVFGWNPTRDDGKDFRPWNWGGNLVVHQLVQEADGTLSVTAPETVDRTFQRKLSFKFEPGLGPSEISSVGVRIAAAGSFGCSAAGAMPPRCKIECTVEFAEGTHGCGIMVRSSQDRDSAYYIRLEPARNRLVLDSWPRPGDVPYWIELERPIKLKTNVPVKLKTFVDGTVCVVYAGDKIAMSTRLYNLAAGDWGVFVNEGSARFSDIGISTD